LASMGEVLPTRPPNHSPALAVTGVNTSVLKASSRTSQTSLCRAAGHSAQMIARIAVSGPRTTMKWLSRM